MALSFDRHADRVDVACDGVVIGTYLQRHEQLTRPAWINLRSSRGTQLTRPFPVTGQENNDHPWFHPGIWISYGHLDGHDFWRLAAPVLHDQFLEEPAVSEDRNGLAFEVRNRYVTSEQSELVCLEDVRYEWHRVEQGLLLKVDAHYRNPDRDFYFGNQEESGLGVRLASPLRVTGGSGGILNDHGDENEAGVWGKEATWCDYSADIEGRRVGVLMLTHPDNPRPCWMHARDYGLLVANPFPHQPQEGAEPHQTWVRQGEIHRFRAGVLLYDVDEPSIDHAEVHAGYVEATRF